MRRAALKVAQSRVVDRDDHAAMTDALGRLYGAASESIDDIVGRPDGERTRPHSRCSATAARISMRSACASRRNAISIT